MLYCQNKHTKAIIKLKTLYKTPYKKSQKHVKLETRNENPTVAKAENQTTSLEITQNHLCKQCFQTGDSPFSVMMQISLLFMECLRSLTIVIKFFISIKSSFFFIDTKNSINSKSLKSTPCPLQTNIDLLGPVVQTPSLPPDHLSRPAIYSKA